MNNKAKLAIKKTYGFNRIKPEKPRHITNLGKFPSPKLPINSADEAKKGSSAASIPSKQRSISFANKLKKRGKAGQLEESKLATIGTAQPYLL